MSNRKNVPASTVRSFLLSDEGQAALATAGAPTKVGERGRIDQAQVAVFHKANKRMRYEQASEAQKPTITVPVTTLDKAGRKATKPVTLTTEAARAALGHPDGRRGRFDKGLLSLALSAVEADKVADQFS
jgi:hypothetical protein